MANSDNVLRGGLTPKNVDVPELLRILDFEPSKPGILTGHPAGPEQKVFRTEAREFELSLVQVPAETPFSPEPGRGVEVLLGLEGDCVLLSEDRDLPLGRGRAVFVPASVPSYRIAGVGRLARAAVPAVSG